MLISCCVSDANCCSSDTQELFGKCVNVSTTSRKQADAQKDCSPGRLLVLSDEHSQLPSLQQLLSDKKLTEVWLGGSKLKTWFWSPDGSTTGQSTSATCCHHTDSLDHRVVNTRRPVHIGEILGGRGA